MDKHDILIVSKSDDNSIYVTTKGDIFEIAAAIKAITGGIVHHIQWKTEEKVTQ